MTKAIPALAALLLSSPACAYDIAMYGDSTNVSVSVYGGTAYTSDLSPVKQAQMMLDAKYGVGTHTIHNFSIGGMSMKAAMTTTPYYGMSLAQHIASRADDIVIVSLNINDVFIPGNTAADHKARYQTIKSQMALLNRPLIYESANPVSYGYPTYVDLLTSYSGAVKNIHGIWAVDQLYQISAYYPNWSGHLSDQIHPNSIMYMFKGYVLGKALEQMIDGM